MKSEDTKRIIHDIAGEEGLSDWAVEFIVKSQFKGVHDTITSATPDHPETFKSVRLNAFAHFKVIPSIFRKFAGRDKVIKTIRRKYDASKLTDSPVLGRGEQGDDKPKSTADTGIQ